jgi:hypothetical protein
MACPPAPLPPPRPQDSLSPYQRRQIEMEKRKQMLRATWVPKWCSGRSSVPWRGRPVAIGSAALSPHPLPQLPHNATTHPHTPRTPCSREKAQNGASAIVTEEQAAPAPALKTSAPAAPAPAARAAAAAPRAAILAAPKAQQAETDTAVKARVEAQAGGPPGRPPCC